MNTRAKDKLIVALDFDSPRRALELFDALREVVGMFKIGSQLFTNAGPDIVHQSVSIFNVHASGGAEMMKRTAGAVGELCLKEGLAKPRVIAVTLLTSIDKDTLAQIGIPGEPRSVVTGWALLAADSGLDGVVASPQEIEVVRQAVNKSDFLIVTPGIRSSDNKGDDQRRVLTAAEAIRAGADYLVVGRPILEATDPVAAAGQIVAEIGTARQQRD
jgi:orotidine-5'-phosphate decarboxylase